MSDFDDLAASVAKQGEALEDGAGQTAVLLCAVAALVRTHPDPSAFANAFRRAWLQLGYSGAITPDGLPASDGIDAALSVLEGNCSVPLNIRPPGVASLPEHGDGLG